MANKKSLTINKEWCKGCGICVAFCPKQVLAIVKEKSEAVNIENCISCGLCELRCPDNDILLVGGNKDEQ